MMLRRQRHSGTMGGAIVMIAVSVACGPAPGGLDPGLQPSEQHHCLALALYWEARAEGHDGMLAVGWVVLNRRTDSRFPATVCEVVRQGGERPGCQFSYWCDGQGDTPPPGALWDLAQAVAAELLSAPPPDPTDGALFYHATSLPAIPWAITRERTARIGNHIYYR